MCRWSWDAVLAAVQRTLGPLIESTGATVRCAALPTVLADATQMEQLFQNLLANALKYRRPEVAPQVEVEAEDVPDAPDLACVAVRDNGMGIPARDHERIFLMFQRLRGDVEGTGIGLAVCRRVVERHGGEIRVQSEDGQGSIFRVLLPRAPRSV